MSRSVLRLLEFLGYRHFREADLLSVPKFCSLKENRLKSYPCIVLVFLYKMNLSVWVWSVPVKNYSGLEFLQRVTLHPVIRVRSKFSAQSDIPLAQTSYTVLPSWKFFFFTFKWDSIRFESISFPPHKLHEPSPRPVPRPQCSYQPVGSPRRTHAVKGIPCKLAYNFLSKRATCVITEKKVPKIIINHNQSINQS